MKPIRAAASAFLTAFTAWMLLATATTQPPVPRSAAVTAPTAAVLAGLDMHDGTIVQDGATFYMYGTQYGCGFTWRAAGTPFCGFAVRHATSLAGPWSAPVTLFSPAALVRTTGGNWATDNGRTWNWVCGSDGAGCFNPRMIHRADGVWILWFNAPGDWYRTKANAYWAMGCNGPAGPCGAAAGAPHGTDHKPSLAKCGDDGDFSILTSGSAAAILCAQGSLSEEQLNASWTGGTGTGTHSITLAGVTSAEGEGGFQLADGTWEITYSDPGCAYCSGPPALVSAAGAAGVHTGYATSPSMLGPWTAQGLLSAAYCAGQPRTVFTADGAQWEWVDRWTGARNETAAAVLIEPMTASPWVCA